MNIDGKQIAHELRGTLKERARHYDRHLRLGVIVVHETPEIRMFVEKKKEFGKGINVDVDVVHSNVLLQTTEQLLQLVMHTVREHDGIILQLPLPTKFSLDTVLKLFPLSHDVDALGHTAFQQLKENMLPWQPPVVAAIAEILSRQNIRIAGHKVLVVGEGRLVGVPSQYWAEHLGAEVTMANKETENLSELTKEADTIILGTGVPGLIKPDMVREGVLIFDAGTSEQGGVLKGDADPACAEKAKIFTPTPGGIGPITVAKVFENLFTLYDLKHKKKDATIA